MEFSKDMKKDLYIFTLFYLLLNIQFLGPIIIIYSPRESPKVFAQNS